MALIQGCGGGGGSSSTVTESPTTIPTVVNDVKQTRSFIIGISGSTANASATTRSTNAVGDSGSGSGASVEVFDYDLSITRGADDITAIHSKFISTQKNSDGSISVTLERIIKADGTVEGLLALQVGDIITLSATGFTPQQFSINQEMLDNGVTDISIKAIESRQTFNLADMISGGDSVTPRSTFGATTTTTADSVVFQTINKNTTLTMPKATYQRLARRIARLPRSSTTTQVHLDMTSVDPRTEHKATIGDFSCDLSAEPAGELAERTISSDDDGENSLESVVMADIVMTTDSGDEMHCFDGLPFGDDGKCQTDTTATLKMKIPQSQFQEYSQKYNNGDRVVPLYSYSKVKATWIRQLDADGKGLNSELILVDNDNDGKANAGDTLYLEGQVGHFSYWNADYLYQSTCMNVNLELLDTTNVSYVYVRGSDYTGATKKYYINADNTTRITGMVAKANAIVDISLVMKDGTIGHTINYATGKQTNTECTEVPTTLVENPANEHSLKVTVEDYNGNKLNSAQVKINNQRKYTDSNGESNFDFKYYTESFSATVFAQYYFAGSWISVEADVTNQNEITIKLDLSTTTFTGTVLQKIDGAAAKVAPNAYVSIYKYGAYSKSVRTDSEGKFELLLPTQIVKDNPTADIRISKYNSDYAYYANYNGEVALNIANKELPEFTLEFSTHKVSGYVTDALNNGIENATVYSNSGRSARTDSSGYYEIVLLGSEGVEVSLNAYVYRNTYLYSTPVLVTTGDDSSKTRNFEIDIRPATITGTVLTSKGVALENMRVYWNRGGYTNVQTDENGYFKLETNVPGEGSIYIYNPSDSAYLKFMVNSEETVYVPVDGVEKAKTVNVGNLLAQVDNFSPIIRSVTIDPTDPLQDRAFILNVDAYDPDGDDLTYTIEQRYGQTDAGTIGSTSSESITVTDAGYHYFQVTVSDGPRTAVEYISFYVKRHSRPVIDSVSNIINYWDKASDMSVVVEAHSDEGNALTYTFELTNRDGTVTTVTNSDGAYTILNTITNANYRLSITVADAYNSTSTTKYFTANNKSRPTIDTISITKGGVAVESSGSNYYVQQGETIKLDANLTKNPNHDSLTWSVYLNGTLDDTTTGTGAEAPLKVTKEMTFNNSGWYYGYAQITGDDRANNYRTFYIVVAANQSPVIDSTTVTPQKIIRNGDGTYVDETGAAVTNITVTVNASDSDSSALTYSFANVDVDGNTPTQTTNSATYSLADLAAGRHAIKVSVTDELTTVDKFVNFEILVNTPPRITSLYVPMNVKVSNEVNLRASATDTATDNLIYKWSTTSGTITPTDAKDAKFTASGTAGEVTITLEVSDGDNNVTRSSKVNVKANEAPVIYNLRVGPIALFEGGEIAARASYGDADGYIQTAKYIIKSGDTNITSFDASLDEVKAIIPTTMIIGGSYTIVLSITDNDGATATSEPRVLSVVPENYAPVISSFTLSKENVLSNEEVTLNVVATDPDGDEITISWEVSGENGELTPDGNSATFKGQYSESGYGEYFITVTVTDSKGLATTAEKMVFIQNIYMFIETDTSSVEVDTLVNLSLFSHGETFDTVSWSVTKPAGSAVGVSSTTSTANITPDVAGTYEITAEVTMFDVVYTASVIIGATNPVVEPTGDKFVDGMVFYNFDQEPDGIFAEKMMLSSGSFLETDYMLNMSTGEFVVDTYVDTELYLNVSGEWTTEEGFNTYTLAEGVLNFANGFQAKIDTTYDLAHPTAELAALIAAINDSVPGSEPVVFSEGAKAIAVAVKGPEVYRADYTPTLQVQNTETNEWEDTGTKFTDMVAFIGSVNGPAGYWDETTGKWMSVDFARDLSGEEDLYHSYPVVDASGTSFTSLTVGLNGNLVSVDASKPPFTQSVIGTWNVSELPNGDLAVFMSATEGNERYFEDHNMIVVANSYVYLGEHEEAMTTFEVDDEDIDFNQIAFDDISDAIKDYVTDLPTLAETLAGRTVWSTIYDEDNTLEKIVFNSDATESAWTEIVGGGCTGVDLLTYEGNTITVTMDETRDSCYETGDEIEVATIEFTNISTILDGYVEVTITSGDMVTNQKFYLTEEAARAAFLAEPVAGFTIDDIVNQTFYLAVKPVSGDPFIATINYRDDNTRTFTKNGEPLDDANYEILDGDIHIWNDTGTELTVRKVGSGEEYGAIAATIMLNADGNKMSDRLLFTTKESRDAYVESMNQVLEYTQEAIEGKTSYHATRPVDPSVEPYISSSYFNPNGTRIFTKNGEVTPEAKYEVVDGDLRIWNDVLDITIHKVATGEEFGATFIVGVYTTGGDKIADRIVFDTAEARDAYVESMNQPLEFTLEMIEGQTFYLATQPANFELEPYISTVEFRTDGTRTFTKNGETLAEAQYEITDDGGLRVWNDEVNLDITSRIMGSGKEDGAILSVDIYDNNDEGNMWAYRLIFDTAEARDAYVASMEGEYVSPGIGESSEVTSLPMPSEEKVLYAAFVEDLDDGSYTEMVEEIVFLTDGSVTWEEVWRADGATLESGVDDYTVDGNIITIKDRNEVDPDPDFIVTVELEFDNGLEVSYEDDGMKGREFFFFNQSDAKAYIEK